MTIPKQDDFYRFVLQIASDNGEQLSRQELFTETARVMAVSDEDRQEVYGGEWRVNKFEHRVDSAARTLRSAGLLGMPHRGQFQITQDGRNYLQDHVGSIRRRQLTELANRLRSQGDDDSSPVEPQKEDVHEEILDEVDPQDLIREGYRQLSDELAEELLTSVRDMTPSRFEDLVADLLVKMGYGQQGERGPRSRDGGIDGVINQDALGLEKVYLQAKQWANPVPSPEITKFSGSLDQFGATKGVFITSSTFSRDAREAANNISRGNKFIRLIDGSELARLMIAHGVGVITEFTYEVKGLDENYFADI